MGGRLVVVRRFLPTFLVLVLTACVPRAQTPGAGWVLAWSDEFAGTALDTASWTAESGPRRDAVKATAGVTVANGALTLRTYTEGGVHKTGYIGSAGKVDDGFGYWEARLRFQSQNGMWSAFWLQSYSISNTGNNPAANGTEIDVVEHRNVDGAGSSINNRIAINVHWDGYGADHKSVGTTLTNPGATALEGNWHTYGVLWEQGIQRFFLDGQEVWSQTTAVSHQNHFIFLTSEVETGGWAGDIPAAGYGALGNAANGVMDVDYVRHYKRAEMLQNGAFDGRLGNWKGYGNRSWSATGGSGGGPGVRVNPQTPTGAAAEQVVHGLIPGVAYRLTGSATVGAAAWPSISLGVKDFGGAAVSATTSATSHTPLGVAFAPALRETSARVYAYVGTQYGDAYADDLRVRREGALNDPGFESDSQDFWQIYGDAFTHTWSPVRSGGVALRFNNPNADRGAEQDVVGLTPSTAYRFSCWARTDNQSFRLGVKNHGAAESNTVVTGNGNVWTRFSHSFTTGPSATSATVYLYVPAANRTSVIDVDDCLLAEALPAGWTGADIGTVPLAGESGRRAARWVLRGAGTDIGSTADSFRFVHTPLVGDGTVTARLRSQETGKTASKLGVMMRAGTAANAAHAHLGWRGDDRMEVVRRATVGGTSTSTLSAAGVRAEWVRIRRLGDTFTPATSVDGVTWTPLGAAQILVMPASIPVGLALTSNDATNWDEGQAESLVVRQDTVPTITAPADQSLTISTSSSPLAATVDDTGTAVADLTLTATSSNLTLLPLSGIVLGGSGANRTVTLSPVAGQTGTAVVTLTVRDGELTAQDSFSVTVTDPNLLIAKGSIWSWLAPLTAAGAPPLAWRSAGFTETGWASGPTKIGYGDAADEATPIPTAAGKPFTVYFRRSFVVPAPSTLASVDLALRRDDGAVVYVNGVEAWRSNLPITGTILHDTPASVGISGTGETTFLTVPLEPGLFVAGANVLAIEVHQRDATSSDLAFDAEVRSVPGNPDTDADDLPDAWETRVFGNLGQTATTDPDADGLNNYAEWRMRTLPSDPASVLRLSPAAATTLSWPTLPGVVYRVWRAEALSGPWNAIGTPITGDGNPLPWQDPSPPLPGMRIYYRVEVP